MNPNIVLEKEAYKVSKQSSIPPLIFKLPVSQGRNILETVQSTHIDMCPAHIKISSINTYCHGYINVYIVLPTYHMPIRSIIFYIHGAGWVFGSFHTHEKLVRELAYRTNSVVIFPEYTRSPEVKFPVAIEECYSILRQIPNILQCNHIIANLNTLTVAGDSVGGNMAIAMTLLSKFNHGPKIHKQLLYYPVTDDDFNTNSYLEFATDYYLYRDGMKWFWNQYKPDLVKGESILATPLKADVTQLTNLPDAIILNGEADVLRDEGKSYANKLRLAGNNVTAVQFQGMIHDFVMLNSLDQTNACRAAMNLSTSWINCKNQS
ncbi:MAG: alpha/beta hydrolase [Clostridia bacterium]|nr:alpha/beta hydrolase [Clostridia bacterium]